MAPRRKPPDAHHHGELAPALVAAGIELLAEGGPAALTLRACAARAGVSHAAPAHHFDGVAGLRAAIAREGFRRFRAAMLRAAEGETTPRGRLLGICRGYLAFAEGNRALFDLIFGLDRAGAKPGPSEEGAAAYAVLREACAPFVAPGQDRVVVESQVWSLIHGFASLSLGDRLMPGPGGDRAGLEAVLALLDALPAAPASLDAPGGGA